MTTLPSTPTAGDLLEPLSPPKITRTTLALFAGASGDHNPMHIDLDVARSAGMSDVFAHGMLSMAFLGRLLTSWVGQEQIVSYGVRFASITPVNSTITCSGRVTSVDGDRATLELEVRLEDGTVTLTGDAVVAI